MIEVKKVEVGSNDVLCAGENQSGKELGRAGTEIVIPHAKKRSAVLAIRSAGCRFSLI